MAQVVELLVWYTHVKPEVTGLIHDVSHIFGIVWIIIPDCLIKGGSSWFFVKLDLEIAVDQENKTRDRTFEGIPDSGWPPVPAGQPRP